MDFNSSKKIIRDILPKSGTVEIPRISKKEENDFLKHFRESEETNHARGRSAFSARGGYASGAGGKEKTFEVKKAKKVKSDFSNLRDISAKEQKRFFPDFLEPKNIIIFTSVLFVAGAIFYVLKPTSLAIVKITPVSKTVSVNVFLKAAEQGGDIAFNLVALQSEKSGGIRASGVKKVESKASGTIVIYNGYSASPQTLVKSTRFETAGGKIYRIVQTITVPGAKVKNGKVITPGSIEAVVYADKPGEEYNIEFSDFTIPGFKGTPRYEKFYGRAKTPISGGFFGNVPQANENDLKNLRLKLEKELEEEIFGKINSQLALGGDADALFIKEASEFKFSYEALSGAAKDAVDIKEKADFSGAIFKKSDIIKFLAEKYLKGTDFEQDVYLKNFDDLAVSAVKKDFNGKTVTLKIEGSANFFKKIDEEKLKDELSKTKNVKEVFARHQEIESAKIIFKPFWKNRLPNNPLKIQIQTEI